MDAPAIGLNFDSEPLPFTDGWDSEGKTPKIGGGQVCRRAFPRKQTRHGGKLVGLLGYTTAGEQHLFRAQIRSLPEPTQQRNKQLLRVLLNQS